MESREEEDAQGGMSKTAQVDGSTFTNIQAALTGHLALKKRAYITLGEKERCTWIKIEGEE